MMRSVYLKTLYDKRYFLFGWTIAFAAIAALLASFYPAMHQDGAIDELLKSMPAAFQGLIGSLADLSRFDTYIASQLFDIRMPLIAGIMAIILGIGLSVNDEEKGELRTVLSLPIGRTKLLVQKWFAMLTIMVVVVLGMVAGMYAVLPFIDIASIEPDVVVRLSAMTLLIMVTFGTIPFAVGFASGRRAAATGISILIIIGSFILSTFGQAVDWLSDYEKLSLLHYFPAVDIVKDGIQASDALVFAIVTIGLLAASIVIFRGRDIA
ncbi:MAG TPA: ABC transporter permease subunit [Candidatus Saccharibacteria bacterium]|nr:ABC transporter permease subunit [Candidatus Saccharibacteria bacterium]HRK94111.1 ABC transporter permease subunit [Candidatus Saccharibacteria bacterium]